MFLCCRAEIFLSTASEAESDPQTASTVSPSTAGSARHAARAIVPRVFASRLPDRQADRSHTTWCRSSVVVADGQKSLNSVVGRASVHWRRRFGRHGEAEQLVAFDAEPTRRSYRRPRGTRGEDDLRPRRSPHEAAIWSHFKRGPASRKSTSCLAYTMTTEAVVAKVEWALGKPLPMTRV